LYLVIEAGLHRIPSFEFQIFQTNVPKADIQLLLFISFYLLEIDLMIELQSLFFIDFLLEASKVNILSESIGIDDLDYLRMGAAFLRRSMIDLDMLGYSWSQMKCP
jgi:hypothetical protein